MHGPHLLHTPKVMAARLMARSITFVRQLFTLTPEEAARFRDLDELPSKLAALEARNGELREAFFRDYARAHIWPRVRFDAGFVPRLEVRGAGAEAPHGLPPAFEHALGLTLAAIPFAIVATIYERWRREVEELEATGVSLMPPILATPPQPPPPPPPSALEARLAALEARVAARPPEVTAAAPAAPAGPAPAPQPPLQ